LIIDVALFSSEGVSFAKTEPISFEIAIFELDPPYLVVKFKFLTFTLSSLLSIFLSFW